ncbi:aminotransferase class I/II-fold pyridoxal phosphate-dependent enzyme [Nocardia sp. NPDC050710]|uniref:aminotransferase class I/II-fold pyridoxal phosphate-dependent enzyme n=1 Tax=Nocardia sp. NPDC050710 TaxID=3157220 RepID=UPI0033D5D0A3
MTTALLPDAETTAYERELGEYLAVDHVVAVSSGTAALQTALAAAGVGPGCEVLVPAVAVVMSAAAIAHTGATPVPVDCTRDGSDFDYGDLAAKVSDRTAAVMPVYMWGRAGDHDRLRRFAAVYGLAVVADACQALGTTIGSRQVGTERGVVGAYSTHHLKLLSTGEGGFITTHDPDIAARARAYRAHWLSPPEGEAPMSRFAHNFRLAEPLAALGRRELARFDRLVAQRIHQTRQLTTLLASVPQLRPLTAASGQRWNAYSPLLQLQLAQPREFSRRLAALGVPNSVGSFGLCPLDQRPMLEARARPCTAAAEFLDNLLAVVITRDDDSARIDRYAHTIIREVRGWAND